ncbi:MAG: hypothetical protein WCC84_14775 [Candidatus Cybelea sp.]
MTYEAIGAFAALGTLVVIIATAIAALIQLRHLRRSNQLSGLLSVLQLLTKSSFFRGIGTTFFFIGSFYSRPSR